MPLTVLFWLSDMPELALDHERLQMLLGDEGAAPPSVCLRTRLVESDLVGNHSTVVCIGETGAWETKLNQRAGTVVDDEKPLGGGHGGVRRARRTWHDVIVSGAEIT